MKLSRQEENWIKILYVIAAGIIVMQALGYKSLCSNLFTMTFPLTVLLWMLSVRKTFTAMDLLMLAVAVIAVLNVLINASICGSSVSFSYLRKVIIFIMTLLFFQAAYRLRVSADVAKFINLVIDALVLYLIMMYIFQTSRMYLYNGRVTPYLTFRFSNPNLAGLFLVCLYMLEAYRLFVPERWYLKLMHIAMALCLGFFVISTRSRNCILAMLVYTAICLWLAVRGRSAFRFNRFWAAAISVSPALFLGAYVLLIYAPWVQKLFSFMASAGKELSSRMNIWLPALEALGESPLIGAYGQLSHGTGSFQMHNTHLDIASSYGLPVLVAVCVLLFRYLYQDGSAYRSKERFAYVAGFACTLMLGMGEAAVFSGGLGIYIFAGTFLLLSGREGNSL